MEDNVIFQQQSLGRFFRSNHMTSPFEGIYRILGSVQQSPTLKKHNNSSSTLFQVFGGWKTVMKQYTDCRSLN